MATATIPTRTCIGCVSCSGRSLGFTIDECRLLLSLYEDKNRASADVKAVALEKVEEIDRKIAELQSLRDTLSNVSPATCHGDGRPDCPIIDDLAGEGGSA
jgi:MerR family copper efflux transcriptional regulator